MSRRRAHWESSDAAWRGPRRPYDLIKELIISGIVVAILVIGLALTFASPDPPAATFQEWATQAPADFVQTTVQEIAGTSLSATYGPPYQTTSQDGSTQGFGPISPETWFGQQIPVDTFEDFVARPLGTVPDDSALVAALDAWRGASGDQQQQWVKAFSAAASKATFADGAFDVEDGDFGPLATIVQAQLDLARSGGLDNAIVANASGAQYWYSNDQTFALLYFGDSGDGGAGSGCISAGQDVPTPDTCWWYNQSVANSAPRFGGYLDGGTWGVVNEVGNWPGAWWLVPYSFWYQWGYGASGQSADLYAMIMTGLVSVIFLLVPWIPGLRDIPRVSRLYRVMWRDYYRLADRADRTDVEGAARGPDPS